MPPPSTVGPDQALETITSEMQPPLEVEAAAEQAVGRWLAAELEGPPRRARFPGDGAVLRSVEDLYAAGAGAGPGSTLRVTKTVAPGDAPPPPVPPGACYRLECGAPLPPPPRVLIPLEAVEFVGSRTIRWSGEARATEDPEAAGEPSAPVTVARGTRFGPRLAAWCAAAGVERVRVYEPPRVAYFTVGSELSDAAGGVERGLIRDQVGPWLAAAIGALPVRGIPLATQEDDPKRLVEAFLRARARRAGVIVAAGGIGDGLTDRTLEALGSVDSRVFFSRLDLAELPHFAYAKFWGIDFLGLPGSPLRAALAWDLFARPLLLARSGAPRSRWDWRLVRRTAAPASPPPRKARWGLWAASSLSKAVVELAPLRNPFAPIAVGAEAWALEPPRDEKAAGRGGAESERWVYCASCGEL